MRSLGPMELVIILAIALLLFGGKKIPEMAKGLGEGIKNFKDADGDQYGEEEGSEKPKNPDCLFPPHQNALKAGGYYRSIEDGKFAYLYESYTFNPCVYW